MKTALTALHRVLSWLLALAVAILIIPVLLQIFSRYVGFIPRYIWTEELARFCFIWMIMIGAMVGVREGTHFDVDLMPALSPRMTAALRMLTLFAVFIFALVFLYYGYQWVDAGREQTSELADLPMWMIFISWPLAGLIWILFLGEQFLREAKVLMSKEA